MVEHDRFSDAIHRADSSLRYSYIIDALGSIYHAARRNVWTTLVWCVILFAMQRLLILMVLASFLAACKSSTATPPLPTRSPILTVIPSAVASATVTSTPPHSATPVPPTVPTTSVATATASASASGIPVPPPPTATAHPPTATATPLPLATMTTPLPPTATMTPTPLSPAATATLTPSPTLRPGDLWIGSADLRIHPDGDVFYSGDLISFQVYAHHGHDWGLSSPPDADVEIWRGVPGEGQFIVDGRVSFYGGQDGATRLDWVWDTTGIQGLQTITVVLDPDDEIQIGDENPDDNVVTRTLELRPRDEMPIGWSEARWIQQASACCVFHYISGTAAERDIGLLMALADDAIAHAGEQLGEDIDQVKLTVYLIDRVLGHGGFAGDALVISYLDRFYAGGEWTQVFRHEGAHVLDRRFAEYRPTLLGEGLAVFVAGGHFREEPISERAAALLALDRYIPLSELADSFYPSQHEIGYLEAAGFVSFLIDRFGWNAFKVFYGDMDRDEAGEAAVIDAALQEHFGLSLIQAEADWLASLRELPALAIQETDLRLTVDFYETVRRYQQAWDPSAYFREPWWPAPQDAERRGLTADLIRHPDAPVNVTLETMFVAADRAIDAGAYTEAESLLTAIDKVLDAGGDLTADPLVDQYWALVQATVEAGYEALQIALDSESNVARVLAAAPDEVDTVELTFSLLAGRWTIVVWGD